MYLHMEGVCTCFHLCDKLTCGHNKINLGEAWDDFILFIMTLSHHTMPSKIGESQRNTSNTSS